MSNPIDNLDDLDEYDLNPGLCALESRTRPWPERRTLVGGSPGIPEEILQKWGESLRKQMDSQSFTEQYLGNFTNDDREYDREGNLTGRRYHPLSEHEQE